jgi:hypothetical protein
LKWPPPDACFSETHPPPRVSNRSVAFICALHEIGGLFNYWTALSGIWPRGDG